MCVCDGLIVARFGPGQHSTGPASHTNGVGRLFLPASAARGYSLALAGGSTTMCAASVVLVNTGAHFQHGW